MSGFFATPLKLLRYVLHMIVGLGYFQAFNAYWLLVTHMVANGKLGLLITFYKPTQFLQIQTSQKL